jgi:hypothetical protein
MQVDPRPIVHIGHHKTGTTWFQLSFYPTVTSHRLIPHQLVREALIGPNGLNFDADRARRLLIEAAGGQPPLLCDERLSGGFLTGGLHGMVAPEVARRIKAVFPDARIVIGIRAQPGMLAAAYSQYVKMGGTFSVKRFLFPDSFFLPGSRYRAHAPRFDLAHFDYPPLIKFYFKLFGREQVQVVPFEQFRAAPLRCASALARTLGLRVDESAVSESVRNPSLTKGGLLVMRLLNLFTARRTRDKWYIVHIPGVFEVRKPVQRALNVLFPGKSTAETLLNKRTLRWIEARFAASNRELAELLDIDLGALGYPVVTPASPPASPLRRWRRLQAT